MSDTIFDRFLNECQEISNGLRGLGNEWPDSQDNTAFNRYIVVEQPNYLLYRYRTLKRKSTIKKQESQIVLIVYSLINRATIIDFQKNKSLVGDLLDSNCDVFLIDWKEFVFGIDDLSLADYSLRFIEECVSEIQCITGAQDVNLAGLCQGGVFSLLYALKNKTQVRSLALMSTPVDFKTQKDTISKILEHLDLKLLSAIPFVSGTMLNSFFNMLAPYSVLQKKYLTLLEKQDDHEYVSKFLSMENWRLDSPNVSGKVLAEFIDIFYLRNSFLTETVNLGEIEIGKLEELTMPILNLCGSKDRLVPSASSKALSRLVSSECKYREYTFDCGHIGMYTYRKAEVSPGRTMASWFCQSFVDETKPI